jgi:hypothetical protein
MLVNGVKIRLDLITDLLIAPMLNMSSGPVSNIHRPFFSERVERLQKLGSLFDSDNKFPLAFLFRKSALLEA